MELMNMVCKVVFKGIDSEGVSGTKRPGKEVVIEDSALDQGLGVSYGGAGTPETNVAFKILTESSNSGASASKSSESGASADSGASSSELGVGGLSIESSMDGLGNEPPSWEGGDANGEVGAEPSDGEGVLDGDGVKPLPESFGGDALGEFLVKKCFFAMPAPD
ncbi:hypothetical protein E3N88_13115 [Mikania micrantha]|uniref:Uncharacterized protein n=1 Tax=Mikania micrantha TaxID=192012 RepID=A0A5N6PAD3_9ASTR|nr:hypothetical protein E3N88_13115 [Mikania micrantha]